MKQTALFILIIMVVLVTGCVKTNETIGAGNYTVICPPAERWKKSAEKIPQVPSGVSGVTIVPQYMTTSYSAHSAIIISSALFIQTAGAQQPAAQEYADRLYASLEKQGQSKRSEYKNAENNITTIVTDQGSFFTVKTIVSRLTCQDGLIIDFIFSKDEYALLQHDMIALINHISYRED